ncbi:energy transducer TonB [Veillonella agrestimuris]|uniref:energy transducer TonB n=1 Tax=Veillonella agrestimuris TaxID=2941340 RepID=UPI00203F874C|nr:TonB family protein [Veillonella agrestimuris]
MKLVKIFVLVIAVFSMALYITSNVEAEDLSRGPIPINRFPLYDVLPRDSGHKIINNRVETVQFIDDKGEVQAVLIKKSSGDMAYDEAIVAFLKESRFEPALGEDGKPVSTIVRQAIFIGFK